MLSTLDRIRNMLLRKGRRDKIIIFVMGQTGAGKSTFINTVTGTTRASVHDGLEIGTAKVETHRCRYGGQIAHLRDREIIFLDTPGVQENDWSVVQEQLTRWMNKNAEQNEVAGIVYLHRLTDNRMTEPPFSTLTIHLCGTTDIVRKVVLLTTMWNQWTRTEQEANQREAEIQANFPSGGLFSRLKVGDRDLAWVGVDKLLRSSLVYPVADGQNA